MKRRDYLKLSLVATGGLALSSGIGELAFAGEAPAALATGDLLVADFEAADWSGWQVTGQAFGAGPARGATLLSQLEITKYAGSGVASSERDGDGPTGTIVSAPFVIQRQYIAYLIGGGDYEYVTCLNLLVDGVIVRSATGRYSDALGAGSWDVSAWRGRTAQIQIVDQSAGDDWGHVNVDQIVQTDTPTVRPVTTQPLYQETLRPQFHFTARQWAMDRLNPGQRQEGWLNDLNGLIYYAGEYHLFAQRWNKCWIHATSTDLIHWTEIAPAFFEERLNSGVQSGGCVIDYANTSGLGSTANPPMVALWSRNDNRSQCLSYSLDKGRTWKMHPGNPVLVAPERDPMIFWHAPTNRWVMMLYGSGAYHVYTSPNLISWTNANQTIPNSFECPDFFQMPLDGNAQQQKWVLVRGNGQYSIGSFDGLRFTEETPQLTSDSGANFYATKTWANTETGDGRRIQVAWMRDGRYPDMPFNQQVSFPCELTLRSTANGPRLRRQPIAELSRLHKKQTNYTNMSVNTGAATVLATTGDLYRYQMSVTVPSNSTLTMTIRGVQVVMKQRSIACGGSAQSLSADLSTVEILVDRTSIEVFANNGEVSISRCFLPSGNDTTFAASGATAVLRSLAAIQLNSAWPTGAVLSGLTVIDPANAANWSLQGNFVNGVTQYGDRAYTVTSVPSALVGGQWIRTANDSRNATANPLVRFTMNKQATVSVAVDTRRGRLPWLDSSWIDTGTSIATAEGTTSRSFRVFAKVFAAGQVSLGPQAEPAKASGMYMVVVN
jgi:fructan beta-fructosidase